MAQAHEIRGGMQVLGSDGGMVGTVDGVEGDGIKLARDAAGIHHFVPLAWIGRIDEHVHLDRSAQLVRDGWTAETGAAGYAGRKPAATDRPATGSKWVWIVGAILLVMVLILGIRGCGYAVSDPNYEEPGTVVDAPAN